MKWIIRNFESIIAAFAFIITLLVYFLCNIDDKILLGLFGTIATLYFGSIKQRIESDRFFKDLFKEFNSRYNSNLNDLLNDLKHNGDRELQKEESNLIIDYFNLCSEEYLWRTKNRIPKKVWESWKSGILENLKISKVREIYIKEISSDNGKKSYYGLIEELKDSDKNQH